MFPGEGYVLDYWWPLKRKRVNLIYRYNDIKLYDSA